MAKINFTKAERGFEKALNKLQIDHLSELAALADVIESPEVNLPSKGIEEIIARFQKELEKLKKEDLKLYERLNLSSEDAVCLAKSPKEFLQNDWLRLKALKLRIDELKHELYGKERIHAEYKKQIAEERHRHINKRINVKDGWLPLK
jgi:hypothetical protein